MKEIEYRTECFSCGRVINREFIQKPDWYTGSMIIITKRICRRCRHKRHYKPDFDEEAAALNAEDIKRMNNLISRRERIR
jgi:hypothetical protein